MAGNGAAYLSISQHTAGALHQQEQNALNYYGHSMLSQLAFFRTQILRLERDISDQKQGVHKFLNYYVAIHGMIITAIYSVQIVHMEMHCATWWVLPVLTAIASVGLIAAIGVNLFRHSTAMDKWQLVTRQLHMFLARYLNSIEGDLLRRSNPVLFFNICNMGMQASIRGDLSLKLQFAQSIAVLAAISCDADGVIWRIEGEREEKMSSKKRLVVKHSS
ncbi:hypothetical protein SUGI_0247150 [Cryptomeria japonica]|nr:hypothetical protein SUGI_0247150 [Cryptomeria japonica]